MCLSMPCALLECWMGGLSAWVWVPEHIKASLSGLNGVEGGSVGWVSCQAT